MNTLLRSEAPPINLAAAISVLIFGLSACTSVPAPPQPVLLPIEVSDRTTIQSARVSWYPDAPETPGPGSLTFGVEMAYARGTGQSDQPIGTNEYISLGRSNLAGPQDVHHHADLRYGHLAFTGIKRFSGRASKLELEWIAGFGEIRLDLRSEGRASGAEIAERYEQRGVVLGVGPRWNITNKLAVEGRLHFLLPFVYHDDFSYPEIAVRYRPTSNVAIRLGYSEMDYSPAKRNGGDSRVHVRLYGPFLGLNLIF